VSRFSAVESISRDHHTADFDCVSDPQTQWLQRHALQAHLSDAARVYVVSGIGTDRVVGYYALAAGSVAHDSVPPRIIKGLGRYPIPVVLLTRLGVDRTEQGRGLGSALVRDAFLQTASIADKLGVRALLIHAETPEAAEFYRRIDPGFEPSPTDPLHLILLMKDLRAAIVVAARGLLRDGPRDEPTSDEARRRTRHEEAPASARLNAVSGSGS
jgi:GNAT superfamily N-acetyltransferase